jgi:FAD/FMN-containing dehydrogenase
MVSGWKTFTCPMRVVLNVPSEADGDLRCQAGARWEDINRTLKEKDIPLFFPVGHFRIPN